MQNLAWTGLLVALLAGGVGGSTLTPFKYVRNWAWENAWLIFAICAYFLSPWFVAVASIPHLFTVYADSGALVTTVTCLLGMGWGFAVVFAGIALDLVGLSMSTALLYGSSVALGSLGALCLVDPSKLHTAQGLRICLWNVVLLAGVWFCARAGNLRESPSARDRSRTTRGIVLSLTAGILATLFNIALAYGEPIRQQAIHLGANPTLAANAIWSLAVSAGSLPSIVWCVYLLSRNSNWHLYTHPSSTKNVLLSIGMGVLWISGTVLYGSATERLGKLGPAIGWPLYQSSIIITGIAWGWFLGEWRGASSRSSALLWTGLAVQVIGIVLLSSVG